MIRKIVILVFTILLILLINISFCYGTTYGDVIKIKLPYNQITIKEGQTTKMTISYSYVPSKNKINIIWSTENNKVATASNGVIKGINKGSTKIKIKIGNKEAYCNVIVKQDTPAYVDVSQCYAELNNYRKKVKVITLKKDKNLENIAKIRAKEMAVTGKFSHTRPNGKSGLSLIKGNLYKGENIAMGQQTQSEVNKAWYNSVGHRNNMLKKQYKKMGIAGYKYKGVIYWVQVFSS